MEYCMTETTSERVLKYRMIKIESSFSRNMHSRSNMDYFLGDLTTERTFLPRRIFNGSNIGLLT